MPAKAKPDETLIHDDREVGLYDPAKLREGHMEILPPEKTEVERQADRQVAIRTEEDAVAIMRRNANRAAEIQESLLERALGVDDKELGSTLRAVSDVQAKSIDGVLKLTGRAPESGDGGVAGLLRALANDGLVRLHVDLDLGADKPNGP